MTLVSGKRMKQMTKRVFTPRPCDDHAGTRMYRRPGQGQQTRRRLSYARR
jgi:hypothetical protein